MCAVLELYARPMSAAEPVICIEEKSLQLVAHSHAPLPIASCRADFCVAAAISTFVQSRRANRIYGRTCCCSLA